MLNKTNISGVDTESIVSSFRALLIKRRDAAMPPRPVASRSDTVPFSCRAGRRYITSGYEGMC